jgi:peptidoglycan biosynthesis protein MviN/MurJ (putative lipid II flippase)
LAYAVGNVRMTVWITASQVITILIVATLLTLAFGAVGTVLGVGVTVTVGFAISALYIFRRLPLSARAVFGAPLIAIIIASSITLLVMSWSGWNDLTALIRLIIISCTAAGGYLISLLALRPGETMERIRYIVRTFRGVNVG